MKKYFLITLAILLTSCSSSDDSTDNNNGNNNSNFSISLSTNTSAVVDEVIPIDITGNETIMTLQASLDNFQTTIFNQSINPQGFGTSATLYFSFDDLGSKNISLKALNDAGDESLQTATVTISRGNAVKITTVQVFSFSNIDGTWDDEFSNTDVNRLADIFFNLGKPKTSTTTGGLGFQNWFTSVVKENQGNLTWDVSSEDLYINPQLSLQYSMADNDGSFNQDLMLGPPFEREITFAEHITDQPNTVTLSVPDIDLEVVLTVEWN